MCCDCENCMLECTLHTHTHTHTGSRKRTQVVRVTADIKRGHNTSNSSNVIYKNKVNMYYVLEIKKVIVVQFIVKLLNSSFNL